MDTFSCCSLLFIVFLQIVGWNGNVKAYKACPCSNTSWCKPISTIPKHEIFTFTFTTNESDWNKFNWTKITTVISGIDHQLTCYAHKNGARSVILTDYEISQLKNATARKIWIQNMLQKVQENFMDGINIDVEGGIPLDRPDLKNAYTTLLNETYFAFKKANPAYQITVDVPYTDNCLFTGRCYDYFELAMYSDFLLVMDYDLSISGEIATSNSPYYRYKSGIDEFLKIGVPKEKLVMAFPWYGYTYPCYTILIDDICVINQEMKKNVTQVLYRDALEALNTSTSGRKWDNFSETPYFNYKKQNVTFQLQYDDVQSLQIKYALAVEMQLRGVGMWTADALNYKNPSQVTSMWKILPDYHDKQYLLYHKNVKKNKNHNTFPTY